MRQLVASGELRRSRTSACGRRSRAGSWKRHPSRMIAVLRECGALAALLPEVDALFGVPQPPAHHPEIDTGVHVCQALDWAAAHDAPLPSRYAVLVHDLGKATSRAEDLPRHIAHEQRSVRIARRVSRSPACSAGVPRHCRAHRATPRRDPPRTRASSRDDARPPACRWMHCVGPSASTMVVAACAADACSRPGKPQVYAPAGVLRDALAVGEGRGCRRDRARHRQARRAKTAGDEAIASGIRAARIAALKTWRGSDAVGDGLHHVGGRAHERRHGRRQSARACLVGHRAVARLVRAHRIDDRAALGVAAGAGDRGAW